ncbi:unnamed protein product [Moneuplotes crassus]|uniref:Kinesin motor domain-containing protein n=1 Tax=Euplotes crassus TaxID=5936 RepID=A0AAD1YAV1_EUPCR|nr:unnamed protein product [Moneuplotes crassus]
MSVKVAARVRPLSQREKERSCTSCIAMDGPCTLIYDVATQRTRTFTFDYSFWSCNGFEEEDDGLLVPSESYYDDQHKVYDQIGADFFEDAWSGYHSCLMAYGQTGSGKSYSLMGYGPNQGIIPRFSQEIFQKIDETTTQDRWYEVSMSMFEIYNERIQDLLADHKSIPAWGLKVRESKKLGIYIQNLSKHSIVLSEDLLKLIEKGNNNKSIMATYMGQSSSRKHTIITLSLNQFEIIDGTTTEIYSDIKFVKMAGSERPRTSNATANWLREGRNINQSLACLGRIITILADKANGRSTNSIVPYRDSVLTRVLSNAFGGNCKTTMLFTLSPADINYEESLSTLRYANRAKMVQNKPTTNIIMKDKMVGQLKNENDRLKRFIMTLINQKSPGSKNTSLFGSIEVLKADTKSETNNSVEESKENHKIEDTHQHISCIDKREDNKFQKCAKVHKGFPPYLVNLNANPQLSCLLYYSLLDSPILVGRATGIPQPHIVINEMGILPNHCVFEMDSKEPSKQRNYPEDLPKFFLRPCAKEACNTIWVNGETLSVEGAQLGHNDRIFIGASTLFLFKFPELEVLKYGKEVPNEITWEFALQEKLSKVTISNKVTKELGSKICPMNNQIDLVNSSLSTQNKKMENITQEIGGKVLTAERENKSSSEIEQIVLDQIESVKNEMGPE